MPLVASSAVFGVKNISLVGTSLAMMGHARALLLLIMLWLLFRRCRQISGLNWRQSFFLAATIWGAYLTVVTEVLSLFHAITANGLTLCWGAAAIAIAVLPRPLPWRELCPDTARIPKLSSRESAVLGLSIGAVLLMALVAIVSPPNNNDSMYYHMARVAHWEQNRSVAVYPTPVLRQLHSNPWAEFAILHFQVMWGSDRLANMVSWAAMAGCLIGVTELARQFGADRFTQLIAAGICCAIPMGVFQAVTTQNDYVNAFWLIAICVLAPIIPSVQDEPNGWWRLPAIGAAIGLALLTKATAYLFAFPFCLVFIVMPIRRKMARMIAGLGAIAVVILILNAGQYFRNIEIHGHLLGANQEADFSGPVYHYSNDGMNPGLFASNVIRALSMQMGTPSPKINNYLERAVRSTIAVFGTSADDPRNTWLGSTFQMDRGLSNEDTATNSIHLMLSAAILIYIALHPTRVPFGIKGYAICLIMAFVLFCLVLRWQPFHSRLLLPLFVLATPLVAWGIVKTAGSKISMWITLVLLAVIPLRLAINKSHPFYGPWSIWRLPRVALYFENFRESYPTYNDAVRTIMSQHSADVGLDLNDNEPEYPLWAMLKSRNPEIHLSDVNVHNASAKFTCADIISHPPQVVIEPSVPGGNDLKVAAVK